MSLFFAPPSAGRNRAISDASSCNHGSVSGLRRPQSQAQSAWPTFGRTSFLPNLTSVLRDSCRSVLPPWRRFKRPMALPAVVFTVLLCSSAARASCTGSSPTWTSTIDQSSVSSCITNAASGDTINVQSGSATWSSVTIPSTKGITLACSAPICTIAGTTALTVNSNVTTGTRITGFTFTGAGTPGTANLELNGSTTSAYYRIDNNNFDVGGNTQVVYLEL